MGDITRSRQSQQRFTVEDRRKAPFVWLHLETFDMELSAHEFRIYVQIVRRAGHGGQCWQTADGIATDVGFGVAVVKRSLARLLELRMLTTAPYPKHLKASNQHLRSLVVTDPSEWDFLTDRQGSERSEPEGGTDPKDPSPRIRKIRAQVSLDEEDPNEEITPLSGSCEAPSGARATPQDPTPGSLVWREYSEGMKRRWRTNPPRNAKTASICKQLVEAVGIDNAMALAKAYPERVDKWYVQNGHPIGLLLSDYPKLLRDLSLGFKITKSMAESLESTYDGAQAIGLAKAGIMPCAIGEHNSVDALPAHDEPLF